MLKKLGQEKIEEILEIGIAEFAANGIDKANINTIAKKAGVSVGVLYKYYENKDAFFMACLQKSLGVLKDRINAVLECDDKPLRRAEKLIAAVQECASENSDYNVMYHEITAGGGNKYAGFLAEEIEGISARIYTQFIKLAQDRGEIRKDMDARMLAFFFDNLLMMLQFSYSCDYYKERFKIFCGEDILIDDEKLRNEMLKFIESAFTTEKSDITHKN